MFFMSEHPLICVFFLNCGFVVVQMLSCVQLFVTSMDCSTPGFPVLLEFAETHVHWVGDAIQPSCPLLSPSPAFNLSLSGRWNAHPTTGKMPWRLSFRLACQILPRKSFTRCGKWNLTFELVHKVFLPPPTPDCVPTYTSQVSLWKGQTIMKTLRGPRKPPFESLLCLETLKTLLKCTFAIT